MPFGSRLPMDDAWRITLRLLSCHLAPSGCSEGTRRGRGTPCRARCPTRRARPSLQIAMDGGEEEERPNWRLGQKLGGRGLRNAQQCEPTSQ
eukprot:6567164-Prymnesium_polylepis.1